MQFNRPFATVTPTLDGDVLTVLATHDVSFTTGQVRRILTDYSEEGIRKVLTRLAVQGVVRADRVGKAFAYRLNSEHIAAQPIKALARLADTFYTRVEEHLAAWDEPPVYGAIFGSAAKGTMTLSSDVDILLIRHDDAAETEWDRNVAALGANASAWTGNDVRVIDYTVSGMRAATSESVLHEVLDHGLTVAGSRAWLLKALRRSPGEGRGR
jgi:predicted nucleotidyltransferase